MKGTTKKQFFDELAETHQRAAKLQASETRLEQQVDALQQQVIALQQQAAALQQMIERLQVLRSVGEAVLAEQSPEAISQLALDQLKLLVPYQRSSVALFDFEANQARVLAVRYEGKVAIAADTGESLGVMGDDKLRALGRGQSVLEGAGAAFPLGPQVIRAIKAEGLPSCLSVPLVAGGAPMGVLNVWAPNYGDLTSEQVEIVHDVAGVLAAALQQASSREKLQRRARELVALYNAAQSMVANLDYQAVLKTIISEAKALLDAEVAYVLIRADNQLILEAAVGAGSESLVGMQIPVVEGFAGWVMRKKQPIRINDAPQDPRFYAPLDQAAGLSTRSVLAVPLMTQDAIIGVVEVVNRLKPDGQYDVFYEQDLEILTAMAGPAAVALENAKLYQARLKQFDRLQTRLAKH